MIPKGSRNICQLAVGIVALVNIQSVAAQNESLNSPPRESNVDLSKPLSWQEACKLIGTQQDPALAEKIEKTIREALKTPQRSEVMACALILQCVDRGDRDAVKAALAGTRSVFPQPSEETQSLMARVRMWLWLTSDEAKEADYANATFRELVTSTHRGALPKPELRAHSQLIGTVCGMLRPELADSPISQENLKIAENCLSKSSISDVKSRFKQSHQYAKERGSALEQTILTVKAKTPVEVEDEQSVRKSKLTELGIEFSNTRELMIEVVRNAREISRQNTLDRRKLLDYIKRLNREWMTPTAGHPGQPPIEPKKPNKSDIKVREYETKDEYDTRTDKDGNEYRVWVGTKKERRDSSDIERERNQIYAKQMAEYPGLKADYDRRIAIYIPALQSWIETDRARREKLQEERLAADARRNELLETNKQLREESSDAQSAVHEQRSEVEVLAEAYELTEIALKSLGSQSVSSAYRPPHFELIDIEDEKFRLLGRIKK